jgi:hypothetical protein
MQGQEKRVNGAGFLAIWSDVRIEQETDYLHWLTREHTSERLSVDGFLRVRVYRSLDASVRRYFIHYELQSPEVVGSAAYLARLNTPTPWSQRIMPMLGNFVRGGGRVLARAGIGEGAFLAAIKLDDLAPIAGPALVANIVTEDRIVAAVLLQTDEEQSSIKTREKSLREHDRSFAGLLLVEGLDDASVAASIARLGLPATDNIYAQVFQLFPQGAQT